MSEYQYYEFVALDKPLSEAEVNDLRQVSSRAEVSSTRFVNVYNYGDFRSSVTELMTAYFNAMVYVAIWGTHRFMVRLPEDLVDQGALAAYFPEESAQMKVSDRFVLLNWRRQQEIWQRVETLLAVPHRRGYDEAAASLRDLHDLAGREGNAAEFRTRLADLHDRHKGKRVFWGNVWRLKVME